MAREFSFASLVHRAAGPVEKVPTLFGSNRFKQRQGPDWDPSVTALIGVTERSSLTDISNIGQRVSLFESSTEPYRGFVKDEYVYVKGSGYNVSVNADGQSVAMTLVVPGLLRSDNKVTAESVTVSFSA